MRQLSKNLFNALKEGDLKGLLEYVKNDDTLDMEFRGNYFTIYYRGGELLTVKENKTKYSWRKLNKKYIPNKYNDGNGLKNKPYEFEDYIPEAKHLINHYICTSKKNHLGEKEIQQLVVKENNYSPNSNDTDYFIVDMEYEESGKIEDGRFDLIALRWDSTKQARQKDEVSFAIIEVKQGYNTIKSKSGLSKHQADIITFIKKKKEEKDDKNNLEAFYEDMKMIFIQKCILGLIKGNDRMKRMKLEDKDKIVCDNNANIDFMFLLANYKAASSNFVEEIMGDATCDHMDPFKIIVSNYMGYGLFSNNIIDISSGISNTGKTYLDAEKRMQSKLFATEVEKKENGLFGTAKNFGGVWNKEHKKWYHYPYVLQHGDSLCNLYAPIRQDVLKYFERYDIAWWGQDSDRYFPTGNLVSSQIQCLNHLFAIRTDKEAVGAIIKNICPGIKEVLSSPIDCCEGEFVNSQWLPKTSYISFEFTLDNHNLLKERTDKRGKKCTSVDAFVYAADDNNRKILIPIEWKYTESYEKSPNKRAYEESVKRYDKLVNEENSNLNGWSDKLEWDPLYEFARQAILMGQIIQKKPRCGKNKQPIEADDFIHIIVRPDENEEIIKDIKAFKENLKEPSKLIEVTAQDLLSPLEEKNLHTELIEYLKKRYWYR